MSKVRKAFKMKLFDGFEEEYKKRHNELWPEMSNMISEFGGNNYSIFLDEETNYLFGYIEIDNEDLWSKTAETEICKKWWAYMADIMETNPDNSPVSIDLKSVFYLK
ncbi:MAG: L-rhamnose mutarotase [Peptostreptococcaceae bacterium]